MSRPLLDLVREQIDRGLDEARRLPLVSHLGVWLDVIDAPDDWKPPTGLRRYIDVAEAGMAFAAGGHATARASFEAGVGWLRQRRFFAPGQPAGLEADPLALVGLAIGLDAHAAADDVRAWFVGIVREATTREADGRRADLLRLALAVVGADDADWLALSPLLQVALSKKVGLIPTPEAREGALAAVLDVGALEPEWAVLNAAALDSLFAMEAAIDLAQPTIEQVADLLRRVPAALKRWPWEEKPKTKHQAVTAQRWDIQHEYHVQSVVWAVLRPVFPALEDEESLPSLGQKHPRADLLVPGLRLVVEVKYLRETTQSARAKIIEEVAADAGLYLTDDSPYDRMIAFIWDATGSTHHHDELAAGVRKIRGIADIVIVSRPGEWQGHGGA